MFLRKDAVDFITRFSIQLNETFENNRQKKTKANLGTFLNSRYNELNESEDNGLIVDQRSKKDKILLHCKWLSSDFNQEFGNFTLHLNRPKDNAQLNQHLFNYFDAKQEHSQDVPRITSSANKVFRRKVGDKVSFFCNVNQPAGVKMTWYRKDNNSFINLNTELKTNQHGLDIVNYKLTANRLTIKELSDGDFAEYICRVSNDYGEDYAFYKLEMIGEF